MAILGATNLTGCNSIPDFIAGGSLVTFQQTAAPTSWTKQTTHNNKALRVVNGTASSGGTSTFSTVFSSRAVAGSVGQNAGGGTIGQITVTGSAGLGAGGGTVGATTLTTTQIASHTHGGVTVASGSRTTGPQVTDGVVEYITKGSTTSTGAEGGNGSHTHPFSGAQHTHPISTDLHAHPFTGAQHIHPFSGTALDFAVQYVDIIICSKN
jgi:hypothetical protein